MNYKISDINQAKTDIFNIQIYDYHLPAERIAKYPLANRDDSKLLLYDGHNISETVFNQLHKIIPDNALLVFNNTKVIRARLHFYKLTGALIEIFCLEPFNPSNIDEAFQCRKQVEWSCMVGNLKKWKDDIISTEINLNGAKTIIYAKIIQCLKDSVIIRFSWDNQMLTFAEILDIAGKTPIPPYLEREAVDLDIERYQTVYSKYNGSVAAPTAGLHFTETLLNNLLYKGIKNVELTLHVGAGTFKPVKSASITDHIMHSEYFSVSIDALEQIKNHSGPIIAVGTTSVRTLESLYIAGIKLKYNNDFRKIEQWDGFEYKSDETLSEIFYYILKYMKNNSLETFEASTSLMIVPGIKFNVIDGLITNFHQPRSTLLLLIAAFIGDDWKNIYQYAMDNDFRFLSYGDGSLLLR